MTNSAQQNPDLEALSIWDLNHLSRNASGLKLSSQIIIQGLLEDSWYTDIIKNIPSIDEFIDKMRKNGVSEEVIDRIQKRRQKHWDKIIRVVPVWQYPEEHIAKESKNPNYQRNTVRMINDKWITVEWDFTWENISYVKWIRFLWYWIYA